MRAIISIQRVRWERERAESSWRRKNERTIQNYNQFLFDSVVISLKRTLFGSSINPFCTCCWPSKCFHDYMTSTAIFLNNILLNCNAAHQRMGTEGALHVFISFYCYYEWMERESPGEISFTHKIIHKLFTTHTQSSQLFTLHQITSTSSSSSVGLNKRQLEYSDRGYTKDFAAHKEQKYTLLGFQRRSHL